MTADDFKPTTTYAAVYNTYTSTITFTMYTTVHCKKATPEQQLFPRCKQTYAVNFNTWLYIQTSVLAIEHKIITHSYPYLSITGSHQCYLVPWYLSHYWSQYNKCTYIKWRCILEPQLKLCLPVQHSIERTQNKAGFHSSCFHIVQQRMNKRNHLIQTHK